MNLKQYQKRYPRYHLVFVGHIGIEKEWVKCVKTIVDQGLHLHLYGKTAYLSKEEANSRTGQVYEKLLKHPFLHLHEPVPQEILSREISQYDYGIWPGYYNVKLKSVTMATGNKFASYVEAGIPTIFFKNHLALKKIIVDKYQAGMAIDFTDLKELKKLLWQHPPESFMPGILKAREDFLMEKQIDRLIDFFDKCKRFKNETKSLNSSRIN